MGFYRLECAKAGWTFDSRAARIVTRIEGDGDRRIFVDGVPYCFWPSDVVLAWNSDAERRKALGL